MMLIISGEGPSDMGVCTNGQGRCHNDEFKMGPMAMLVDKIADNQLGYSPALDFVSEGELSALMKKQKKTLVTGLRRGFETGYFFKGARVLARLAKQETEQNDASCGVVFFRDADGTRSTERGLYETRVQSMNDGFAVEEFELGVPMVPKPKSEAWLICALKPNAYQNCATLEDSLSGNDNAPEPAKAQMEELLAERGKEVTDLADLVSEGMVDALHPGMKDMKSYEDFDKRLRTVLTAMQRHGS